MIDPSAFIAPGAIVLGDVHLGAESSIWYNAVLRGDTDRITIGDHTNIQDLTMIHADPGVPCTVGCRVTVGHRVILHGCIIEDDCLIGMGAIVLNGARIGRGSIVGAGALVLENMDVPPGSLVVGAPARIRREVDEDTRERVERGWKHYVEQARRHKEGTFPIQPPTMTG
jgi:carbonic anhydrase/acetyltransferase-like protein (isoleucine patch superfamily)